MKKPLIGMMPRWNVKQHEFFVEGGYIDALFRLGGVPVMLPPTTEKAVLQDLISRCDGIIFVGGDDIDPTHYGEERLPACGTPVPLRDQSELLALEIAGALDLPILGICRGEQLINVGFGGSLYQDFPSQCPSPILHEQTLPHGVPTHKVKIDKNSPLYEVLGVEELVTNSYHHQGIKDPAPGMKIMAQAEDGVVEAFYFPEKRFVWGIQWHPESSLRHDDYSIKIFEAFLQAAKQYTG